MSTMAEVTVELCGGPRDGERLTLTLMPGQDTPHHVCFPILLPGMCGIEVGKYSPRDRNARGAVTVEGRTVVWMLDWQGMAERRTEQGVD